MTEKDELEMWNDADETALRRRMIERLKQYTCPHYVVVDNKCSGCGAGVPWTLADIRRFSVLM